MPNMTEDDAPAFEKFTRRRGGRTQGETWSMCRKKTTYNSVTIARRVQAKVMQDRGADVRIYRCPVCRKWHLSGKGLKP